LFVAMSTTIFQKPGSSLGKDSAIILRFVSHL
jgi:hypothetical protein